MNIPVGTIDPFHNIMEPIPRPKKGFRPEVTSLTGIRSNFCLWVDAAKNKNLSRNQCLVMMRLWGCTCDRCIDGNFSECKLSPEFSPVILEAKPANSLAKTRSTRAINSDARRKSARQARVDDYLAVENPNKMEVCKFWLARVSKAAHQHRGGTVVKNGVNLVNAGYYIDIHVFKPKKVGGAILFEWDRDPYGAGTSSWTVDAECVLMALPKSSVVSVGRRSTRTGNSGIDAYELKEITSDVYEKVMEHYLGKLAEL